MREPVAVIGGGLMGAGIAQMFAVAGHRVRIHEPFAGVRTTIRSRISQHLAVLDDPEEALDRIEVTDDLAFAVADACFVTEAAPEKLDLKRQIFTELERLAPRQAILASNSSVMPIGGIAEGLETADRIVGTHWWNPATLIPLVEVIQGARTSMATIATTMRILESIGKKPAHIRKDIAGFVANRLQHALWREAIGMVADGICDARTIDDCVKNSFGLRLPVLGPLENADLVGIDLTRDIHHTIIPELNRDAGPNPLLDQLIADGKLGFKTGAGLQAWTADEMENVRARLTAHLLDARSKLQ